MFSRMFPHHVVKNGFANLSLDDVARRLAEWPEYIRMRREDPVEFQRTCARHLGNTIVYGGWMEIRSNFLAGTYLDDEEKYVHLGVDVWVSKGTAVMAPMSLDFVDAHVDSDSNGGWGGVALLKHPIRNGLFFLFAHLAPQHLCSSSRLKGELIGRIGGVERNGGWCPHLHIQAIDQAASKVHLPELDKALSRDKVAAGEVISLIEGYAQEGTTPFGLWQATVFPDPLPLLL